MKVLRTASIGYNFTGSYKKSVGIFDHYALTFQTSNTRGNQIEMFGLSNLFLKCF